MNNPKDDEHSPVCACPDCWPKNEKLSGFATYEDYEKAETGCVLFSAFVLLVIGGILLAVMLGLPPTHA